MADPNKEEVFELNRISVPSIRGESNRVVEIYTERIQRVQQTTIVTPLETPHRLHHLASLQITQLKILDAVKPIFV